MHIIHKMITNYCSQILLSFIALFAIGNISLSVEAQGIRIIDCRGNTRALKQQPTEVGATSNQVSIAVVDSQGLPNTGGLFKLTNGKGEVITTVAREGIAEFKDVGSGVWMLGSDNSNLFFTSISLTDVPAAGFWDNSGSFLSEAGKIALIAGAVVGAGVIIHETTKGGGGSGGDNPVTPPAMGCPSCNPDASAPSLPPFQ